MAAVDFPAALATSKWDAQKAALAKDKTVAAKLSAAQLGESLKTLSKLHGNFDYDIFDAAAADTSADCEEAIADVDQAVKGSLKALRSAAKSTEAEAGGFATDAEKVRKTLQGPASTLVAAVIGVASAAAKAASAFDRDLAKMADSARAELQARLTKLKAQEKKAPPGGTAMSPAVVKLQKLVRAKVLAGMRAAKFVKPGGKKTRFVVAVGKIKVTAFLAPTAGPGQRALLYKLMNEKPNPKCHFGEVIFENKAYTFAGATIPTNIARRLQKGLLDLTKIRYPLRVRKGTEVAEEPGTDEPEDAARAGAAEDAKASAASARDFADQYAKLKSAIAAAMKAPHGDELDDLAKALAQAIKDKDLEAASDALGGMETYLEDAGSASSASTGGSATAPPVEALKQARRGWEGARKDAVDLIKTLQKKIATEFKSEAKQMKEVKKALVDLQERIARLEQGDLAKQLDAAISEADPARRSTLARAAKSTVQQLASFIDGDTVMKEIDNNELVGGVVVAPMKQQLSRIEAALG